jgi:hypothetical protein
MVKANMKTMIDALPKIAIIFLTTCWPVNAAMVATKTKYEAASKHKSFYFKHNFNQINFTKSCLHSLISSYHMVPGSGLEGNIVPLT